VKGLVILLFVETHASGYANHFFLAQADEVSGADEPALARCRAGPRRTYASIDRMVSRLVELDDDTLVVLASDHGGTPNQFPAVDVAPTLCMLLGLPMPANVEGGVIYEALENPNLHLGYVSHCHLRSAAATRNW